MNKNTREVIYFFMRDILFSQLIVIQLVICFSICIFSISFRQYYIAGSEKYESKYVKQNYFQLSDRFEGDEFLEDESMLFKLILLHDKLTSSDDFSYLDLYKTSVDVKDFEGEEKFYYEKNSIAQTPSLKALYTGYEMRELYDLNIESGSWFEKSCYETSSYGTVPVVLGYKYKDIYAIGDIIESVSYISGISGLEVTGFLAENTVISCWSKFETLDYYMILPLKSNRNIPHSKDVLKGSLRKWLILDNGEIISEKSAETVQLYVNEICNELKIEPPFIVIGAKNQMTTLIHTDIKECDHLLTVISYVLVVFAFGIMTAFLIINIKKNIKYFSILLISGFNYFDIYKIIFGQSFVYQAESMFFSICASIIMCNFFNISFKLNALVTVIIISAFAVIFSSLAAYFNFLKYDIAENIRKK